MSTLFMTYWLRSAYRSDEFLPPLLSSEHFLPMLIAFWVMRDLPYQLLLQTDHLVFERLKKYIIRMKKLEYRRQLAGERY